MANCDPNLLHVTHFVAGVGSSNFIYALTETYYDQKSWVSTLKVGSFGQILAKFWPNLVHLTHFVTGVGSSNLIYVLAVEITVRNLL